MTKSIFTFLFLFIVSVSCFAQTIHVATNGNDATGTGTEAKPYKTIVKGVQAAPAGGTVLVKPGIYNEKQDIVINKALTLKKNTAIAGDVTVDANSRGTGDFKSVILISNPNGISNVTVDGIAMKNNIGNGCKGVYIIGSGSNITITNCYIENIGWRTAYGGGLSVVQNNSSIACSAIKVEATKSTPLKTIVLLNNVVTQCATGWGEAVTLTGNIDGFTVKGNTVSNIANIGIVAAGNYPTGAPAASNQARNGSITSNTVSACMSPIANSAGIYLDGSINCTVDKNSVTQSGVGISIGGEQALGVGAKQLGGHIIKNNKIFKNVICGIFIGTNNPTNSIGNTKIYNNTFFKNRTGAVINGVTKVGGTPVGELAGIYGGDVQLQNSKGVAFINNIVYASNNKKAFVALDGFTVTNFVSNYNIYYRDGNTNFILDLGGKSFNQNTTKGSYNLAQFVTQTGLEKNSFSSAPGFIDAGQNNVNLTTNAFAKNKGDVNYSTLFSGNTDFLFKTRNVGGRVDIGCYEVQTVSTARMAESQVSPVADEEVITNTSFSIYPNPAKDYITINFGKNIQQGTVSIMDASGKIIFTKTVNNVYTDRINIAALKTSSQLLFIKIAEGNTVTVNKLLVQ